MDAENKLSGPRHTSDTLTHVIKGCHSLGSDPLSYRLTVEPSELALTDSNVFFSTYHTTIIYKKIDEVFKYDDAARIIFNLHGSFIKSDFREFDIKVTSKLLKTDDKVSCSALARNKLASKLEDFQNKNKEEINLLHLDVHVCSLHWYQESDHPYFKETKGVVHVSSTDGLSFKWAVLAALHPEVNKPSVDSLEPFSKELILDGIEHPGNLEDLPIIESLNNISFNVFMFQNNQEHSKELKGPIYHTTCRRETHINLLKLLSSGGETQYAYIKNFNLLADIKGPGHICDGCLCVFDDTDSLQRHQNVDCLRIETIMAPDIDNTMKFNGKNQQLPLPIVVYADFKVLLEPIKGSTSKVKNSSNKIHTINMYKHVPYSFAYYIKCHSDETLSSLKTHYGLDCVERFEENLMSAIENIVTHFDNIDFVPVFFHNFTNYLSHFLVNFSSSGYEDGQEIISGCEDGDNYALILNSKYMNDRNIEFRYLDAPDYFIGSLQNLAKHLDISCFQESRKYWRDTNDEAFGLLTQKSVALYTPSSLKDLNKEALPEKTNFYDRIKERTISDDDYERALRLWTLFDCKKVKDYAMICLKSSVLILADLFENVRTICLNTYEIDPARYNSLSNLTWNAMLQDTQVELELLTDVNMLAVLKKGMNGEVAHCSRRHAVANNKHLPKTYDESNEHSYIMCYKANRLYEWAMCQPLPYQGFEWTDTDVDFKVPADSDIGYYLEVDLGYPYDETLHDWHADYPFHAEKKHIFSNELGVPDVTKAKCIADLSSKKRCVLHHSYLVLCLQNGLVLEKIHRVLKFKQKPWLKPYIDLNNQRKEAAESILERKFYESMNKGLFDKIVKYDENNLFHLVTKYQCILTPEYYSHVKLTDSSVLVKLKKARLLYNTPVYVGYCIQNLATTHMYEFHYGFMKQKFGTNLKLLYTDTDTFVYQIFTNDFYSDMRDCLEDRFDTSDYPVDNQFEYPHLNESKSGYFKDELKGDVVKEFVALRPKVYMIEADKTKTKEALAPNIVIEQLTLDDYKRCLYEQEPLCMDMCLVRDADTTARYLYTQHVRKVVLSPLADPSRHLLENKIDSLPFGHYRLKNPN